jgi:N,N'-diacetyllegionaminate synthase
MRTKIIAEAGVNHNGCLETAIELVNQAAECGADIVKFQCFRAAELVTKHAEKAAYQKTSHSDTETQYEMLKGLELSELSFVTLAKHANSKNIEFLSTPFSIRSANFLNDMGQKSVKISSGDITDKPLLEAISRHNWDIIFSTGMSSLEEVDAAFKILSKNGAVKDRVNILLCTSQYPTPPQDVHLNAMTTLRERYGVSIGLSDHTTGIHIPIAAVAMGASIIEKHFTLDKNDTGPDHAASIDASELSQMVKQIRDVEIAKGLNSISIKECEKDTISKARKSIVAKEYIKIGDTFTHQNLSTMRPGTGISPMEFDRLVGAVSKKNYKPTDVIKRSEL